MILVFKTTVSSKARAKKLEPYINQNLPGIQWNFDLSDCDRVLRVDSPVNITNTIISLLNDHGYDCSELD
jgi:tRNA G26 N,N-dimethylase Trm1